jgi:hypothetical protein
VRICSKCKQQIGRSHRWREVNHVFLWLFRWKTVQHHNCERPCAGPVKTVKRLKGEVPLLFPEQMEYDICNHGEITPKPSSTRVQTGYPAATTYTYHNSKTGQESQPTLAPELARVD